MSHVQANASVAYHAPISPTSSLGAGLQFGYAQRSLNTDNLKWGSQFDGSAFNSTLPGGLPAVSERRGFVDFGAGLVWQYRRGEKYMTGNDQRQITAGLAVFHPHRPDQSFFQTKDRLATRTVLFADALIGLPNTDLALCPTFLFASQGPLTETTAGIRLRKVFERQSTHTGFLKGKAASIGTAFRLGDAIIPSVSIELGPLDIGLSYDINISSLNTASRSRGGTEASVRYLLSPSKKTSRSSRY
jgi:type IX secretion system PorP/SprF family membrane protein